MTRHQPAWDSPALDRGRTPVRRRPRCCWISTGIVADCWAEPGVEGPAHEAVIESSRQALTQSPCSEAKYSCRPSDKGPTVIDPTAPYCSLKIPSDQGRLGLDGLAQVGDDLEVVALDHDVGGHRRVEVTGDGCRRAAAGLALPGGDAGKAGGVDREQGALRVRLHLDGHGLAAGRVGLADRLLEVDLAQAPTR